MQERSVVNDEIIKEVCKKLLKDKKHAESLIIYFIFAFKLYHGDIILLKFEDIKNKYNYYIQIKE